MVDALGDITVVRSDREPSWLTMLRFVPLHSVAVVANANPLRVLDAVKSLISDHIRQISG